MMKPELNLIWIDLEMTGLDPETDRIIEVATLVTDSNLNLIAEGPSSPLINLNRCLIRWTTGTKSTTDDRV